MGDATNNKDLQAEGLKDQAAAKAKQSTEDVKDSIKDAKNNSRFNNP